MILINERFSKSRFKHWGKCYYIHNTKNGWLLAIVEVVEFKTKTLIVKFVDVSPSEEYESKNYHGWYCEGALSNPITPFTLIKIT